ncbi:hypothetical protein NNJEOMEG_01554 [Fundidesulfovibrio magnetotacticus]|uniref:Uncharacterized protein n=1 Tax=Fundidesulfovibrio magnetotacticus TaxID=2730080 RepID=A0A6V8LRW6_9BACT|nr:hypothetical protein [Fundidesulfovibrio magnetotacticus]GFK93720.1 hypothetical protein NNJEOMEG_01554 [Fundidesulfovibrio magnetotacticus]
MKGVWDGLDKERIGRAAVTAFDSDEYLELLARLNNAESLADIEAARESLKDVMALWRQECPEYAFMVDCLYLFSERMALRLDRGAP